MTTLRINIEANNAAFDDDIEGRELARIVHSVADDLVLHGTITRETLRDINGNAVGEARIVDDDVAAFGDWPAVLQRQAD